MYDVENVESALGALRVMPSYRVLRKLFDMKRINFLDYLFVCSVFIACCYDCGRIEYDVYRYCSERIESLSDKYERKLARDFGSDAELTFLGKETGGGDAR